MLREGQRHNICHTVGVDLWKYGCRLSPASMLTNKNTCYKILSSIVKEPKSFGEWARPYLSRDSYQIIFSRLPEYLSNILGFGSLSKLLV